MDRDQNRKRRHYRSDVDIKQPKQSIPRDSKYSIENLFSLEIESSSSKHIKGSNDIPVKHHNSTKGTNCAESAVSEPKKKPVKKSLVDSVEKGKQTAPSNDDKALSTAATLASLKTIKKFEASYSCPKRKPSATRNTNVARGKSPVLEATQGTVKIATRNIPVKTFAISTPSSSKASICKDQKVKQSKCKPTKYSMKFLFGPDPASPKAKIGLTKIQTKTVPGKINTQCSSELHCATPMPVRRDGTNSVTDIMGVTKQPSLMERKISDDSAKSQRKQNNILELKLSTSISTAPKSSAKDTLENPETVTTKDKTLGKVQPKLNPKKKSIELTISLKSTSKPNAHLDKNMSSLKMTSNEIQLKMRRKKKTLQCKPKAKFSTCTSKANIPSMQELFGDPPSPPHRVKKSKDISMTPLPTQNVQLNSSEPRPFVSKYSLADLFGDPETPIRNPQTNSTCNATRSTTIQTARYYSPDSTSVTTTPNTVLPSEPHIFGDSAASVSKPRTPSYAPTSPRSKHFPQSAKWESKLPTLKPVQPFLKDRPGTSLSSSNVKKISHDTKNSEPQPSAITTKFPKNPTITGKSKSPAPNSKTYLFGPKSPSTSPQVKSLDDTPSKCSINKSTKMGSIEDDHSEKKPKPSTSTSQVLSQIPLELQPTSNIASVSEPSTSQSAGAPMNPPCSSPNRSRPVIIVNQGYVPDSTPIINHLPEEVQVRRIEKWKNRRRKQYKEFCDDADKKMKGLSAQQIRQGERWADNIIQQIKLKRELTEAYIYICVDSMPAAIEIRDNPSLMFLPLGVCSKFIVRSVNFHAQNLGVEADMPLNLAFKICPILKVVPCNFEKYNEATKEIREIIKSYDDRATVCKNYAVMNITKYLQNKQKSLETFVRTESMIHDIKKLIFAKTGLVSYAGFGPTPLLAKLGSVNVRPNGIYCISNKKSCIDDLLQRFPLPVTRFWGVSSRIECLLHSLKLTRPEQIWRKRGALIYALRSYDMQQLMCITMGCTVDSINLSIISKTEDCEFESVTCVRGMYETQERLLLWNMCVEISDECAEKMKAANVLGKCVLARITSKKVRYMKCALHEISNDASIILQSILNLLDLFLLENPKSLVSEIQISIFDLFYANSMRSINPGEAQSLMTTPNEKQRENEKVNLVKINNESSPKEVVCPNGRAGESVNVIPNFRACNHLNVLAGTSLKGTSRSMDDASNSKMSIDGPKPCAKSIFSPTTSDAEKEQVSPNTRLLTYGTTNSNAQNMYTSHFGSIPNELHHNSANGTSHKTPISWTSHRSTDTLKHSSSSNDKQPDFNSTPMHNSKNLGHERPSSSNPYLLPSSKMRDECISPKGRNGHVATASSNKRHISAYWHFQARRDTQTSSESEPDDWYNRISSDSGEDDKDAEISSVRRVQADDRALQISSASRTVDEDSLTTEGDGENSQTASNSWSDTSYPATSSDSD